MCFRCLYKKTLRVLCLTDLDPAKAKSIQDMEPPTTCTLLKNFIMRVSYLHGIHPALVELLKPFHTLLKKNALFKCGEEQEIAFQKVKDVLHSPLTMISRIKDLHIIIYLTSTDRSTGTLLA